MACGCNTLQCHFYLTMPLINQKSVMEWVTPICSYRYITAWFSYHYLDIQRYTTSVQYFHVLKDTNFETWMQLLQLILWERVWYLYKGNYLSSLVGDVCAHFCSMHKINFLLHVFFTLIIPWKIHLIPLCCKQGKCEYISTNAGTGEPVFNKPPAM